MSSHLPEIPHDFELSKNATGRLARPAEDYAEKKDDEFVVIVQGTCGTIFEIPGTEPAYKKGRDRASLWNDVNFTNTACRAVMVTKSRLEKIFPNISIPRVPYSSREALIRLYFPKKLSYSALQTPYNNACIIRLYLGQRRTERELPNLALNLEKFPLYLDQVEELQLDAAEFSKEMAVGLAIIHWEACMDGMDVEFVLGSEASFSDLPLVLENFKGVEPFKIPSRDFERRQIHLWMLDFDKAGKLNFQDWKSSRDKMAIAVTGNDP
ncbi:hypothetical protein N7495_008211 [Penicillium taxi]|uniref:uncharacterized protein n=1 Tax=Penicillium taxi TaxID=168475 RepID=UPI00254569CE|nr:uncharacterized protein N7495_008211 [Penicillium taxi]KAJ5888170.1 hypothetical protein N7495_008211 [Penicillium taxi]